MWGTLAKVSALLMTVGPPTALQQQGTEAGSADPALSLKRFHQRRFFTNFISARAAMPVNSKSARCENVLAQEAFRIRAANRLLHG